MIKKIFLAFAIFFLAAQNLFAATTVVKNEEDSFKSAAAIYIINRTDIKRSGATTIPELLRTVPGLQVSKGESGQWTVTSRGFANGFANKLLVMVDGRIVYNALFSGVYWGVQDVMLENIKQIEVIRGPGATQWGANAVNGVINIITETAANTQGGLATAMYGNDRNSLMARYGDKIEDNSYYRIYVSRYDENDIENLHTKTTGNDFLMNKAGFRVDYDEFEKDQITLQGDIYHGDNELDLFLPDTSVGSLRLKDNLDINGGNILSKWERQISDKEDTKLQLYYDKDIRDYSLLLREAGTFDADFQYSNSNIENHKITAGFGYRTICSYLNGSSFRLNFNPTKRNIDLYSAFLQDEITLLPDKLFLTIGSKIEHNDFTGYEVQPSIKTSLLITPDQTLWASIARAVRTPNISENDIKMVVGTSGSNYIRQEGDGNFDSEKLIAYEFGYRIRPTNDSIFNIATFYNDYDELRSAEFAGITTEGTNSFSSVAPQNKGKGTAIGFELDGSIKITPKWELKSAYTFLKLDLDAKVGSNDSELEKEQRRSPMHQFNIQSRYDITNNLSIDNILYYVDSINVTDNNSNTLKIPSYFRFDTRIGWQYSKNISFDLVGQNLIDGSHTEFSGALWAEPIKIGRTVYGKVTLKF